MTGISNRGVSNGGRTSDLGPSTSGDSNHGAKRSRRHEPGERRGPPRTPPLLSEIVTFVVLVYVSALTIAVLLPGSAEVSGPAPLLTLLVPAVALGALRTLAASRSAPARGGDFGLRRLAARSWPLAIALPVAAVCASLAAAYLLGVIGFHELPQYVAEAPLNIAFVTILLLGEEIGWRGWLFPRLAESLPVRAAAVLTGLIHGLFHLPLLLLTDSYDVDGNRLIVAPGVVAVVTLGGVIFGWLRTTTDSLWPVLIAHAAVNTCFLASPVLVSDNPDLAAHLTGEGGVFTVLTVGAAAVWILRRANWSPPSRGPGLGRSGS